MVGDCLILRSSAVSSASISLNISANFGLLFCILALLFLAISSASARSCFSASLNISFFLFSCLRATSHSGFVSDFFFYVYDLLSV